MMAVLWDDIDADLASAKRHFGEAVALYHGPMKAGADYVVSMAFQHAMQAGSASFENGLKRLLHLLDEPMPAGPDFHAALVRRLAKPIEGARPALLADPLLGHIEELRRFRHVAMHSYDDFSPRKAVIPVEAAEAFLTDLDPAIALFRRTVDPP